MDRWLYTSSSFVECCCFRHWSLPLSQYIYALSILARTEAAQCVADWTVRQFIPIFICRLQDCGGGVAGCVGASCVKCNYRIREKCIWIGIDLDWIGVYEYVVGCICLYVCMVIGYRRRNYGMWVSAVGDENESTFTLNLWQIIIGLGSSGISCLVLMWENDVTSDLHKYYITICCVGACDCRSLTVHCVHGVIFYIVIYGVNTWWLTRGVSVGVAFIMYVYINVHAHWRARV